ncbi:MAG: hypothetical protein ACK5PZ_03320, partial [Pirellula sp.]
MSLILTVNAGSLSLSNISDLSVAGNGTSYLTLRGSVSQLNAALGYGLTYRNNDGFSGMDVLNIQTSDLGSTGTAINTDSDSVSIEVVAAPTAPTATNLTQTRVYLDGTTGIRFSNIVISDPDVTETISASLTLSNPSHGLLTANDGATYDSFTGVWTVTGTVAQVNAAFANVQFQPASFVVDETIISVRIQDASSMGPSDGTITLRRSMLNATGDSGAGIGYGHVTATDGNRIVVGARLADGPSSSATGAVFVYERFADGSWIQTARLTASDASPSDFYGRSVAVDGDMIVVGSQMSEASGVLDTGAIYAYRWNGSAWVETKLVASDLAQSDQLGMSVAISGNNIVVGSILDDPKGTDSGSAYVFSWDGTTFTQTAKLIASDGGVSDRFGGSVDIDGTTIVVGASFANGIGQDSGKAYVYQWNGTAWVQEAILVGLDTSYKDQFGSSVAISGQRLVVGSAYADTQTGYDSGAAYVFTRNADSTWTQTAKLVSPGTAGDLFGTAVALEGNTLAIGSPQHDGASVDSGAVFVYTSDGLTWSAATTFVDRTPGSIEKFGMSVALSNGLLLAGTEADDQFGNDNGSVTIFNLSSSAPVNTVPVPQTVEMDQPLILSAANGNELRIDDADALVRNLSVTLSTTTGTLTLSTTTGLSVSNNGTGSIAITGTGTAINAALASGLTFIAPAGFFGNVTLTMATDDLGNHATASSTDTDVVSILVNAVPGPILAAGPGDNLLVNGSFETGLANWATSGTVSIDTSVLPSDGLAQAVFSSGGMANDGVISQAVNTVVGRNYTLFLDIGATGLSEQRGRIEVIGSNSLLDTIAVARGSSPTDHRTLANTFTANSISTIIRISDTSV